ncbi:MAG: non-homologous end-joining DNA ligase, partial [Acidimicrobiia bacterium]
VRSIAYTEGGRARFESRNGAEITARYPELRGLGRALGSQSAVLDGEIVALDESGRPSFERLQRRMHVKSESTVKRLSSEVPVAYMVFDLLFFDGHSSLGLPYTARRRLLEGLELAGPSWHTPRCHPGEGRPLYDASSAQGLEGILAKRLDSTYEPGARSRAWLKVKHHRSADLVIGGYLPGEGGRLGRIGALLLGYHEPGRTRRSLRFAGRVGTGFTDAELARLALLFAPLQRETSPFSGSPPLPDAVFLEPELVARVSFAEWTRAGSLRHPSYQGLRDDLDPSQVERDPLP